MILEADLEGSREGRESVGAEVLRDTHVVYRILEAVGLGELTERLSSLPTVNPAANAPRSHVQDGTWKTRLVGKLGETRTAEPDDAATPHHVAPQYAAGVR
jgi:hypothetical protein